MHTPRLAMPLLAAAQSQKHVTHNESLMDLDGLVQLSVATRSLSAPPASPPAAARYLVGASPSSVWSGREGEIAMEDGGAWTFKTPRPGWLCWVEDERRLLVRDAASWIAPALDGIENAPKLGVNTSADNTTRLQVKSDASLFDAQNLSTGHRLTINKAQSAATATAIFQTGYSGRAELGLAGDDHFRIKLSSDGTQWRDILLADNRDGRIHLPSGPALSRPNFLINGDFRINQRGFSGGSLAAGAFGPDRWRAETASSLTLSGGVATLAGGVLTQNVERALWAPVEGFQNATLTLSWRQVSGAQLQPTVNGLSAAPSAQLDGRIAMTVTLGAGATGDIVVRLAAPASSSFSGLMLERGPNASAHAPRNSQDEARLCQRYYWERSAHVIGSGLTYDVYTGDLNTYDPLVLPFPVEMRAAPAATLAGTFTPVNIFSGDQPLQIAATPTEALLRARGGTIGRRFVTCSAGARLRFDAEI